MKSKSVPAKKMRPGARPEPAHPRELREFADSIGDFIQYFGFKRVHGQIWAHLFLSERPMAAVELARVLGVSKTLLSFSIAELLQYQVIQEAGRGERRTTYFAANPDVTSVILNVLRNRERKMLENIQSKLNRLSALPSRKTRHLAISPPRLNEVSIMVATASTALAMLIGDEQNAVPITDQLQAISAILEFGGSKKEN